MGCVGFIGGEDNQWNPALYEGTTPIEPPGTPEEGYHLTEDLADKAIAWTRQPRSASQIACRPAPLARSSASPGAIPATAPGSGGDGA